MSNYFITSMTKGPIDKNWKSRTFGYFDNLGKAIDAVLRNVGGLDECLYDYCIIEPVPPGIYGFLNKENNNNNIWFEWTVKPNEYPRWTRIKECPKEFENIYNFAF